MSEMTKSNPLVEAFEKAMQHNKELDLKSSKIREVKTNAQFNKILENEVKKETLDKIDLWSRPPEYYKELEEENSEYLETAKTAPVFLTDDFNSVVPFFKKNLIIIGAKSGEGKSTIAANIAFTTIGQAKRCLMITNEEVTSDVFNRVTCLMYKWSYTNHKKFTNEQKEIFNKNYSILGQRLSVIEDITNGTGGTTTSIQGLKSVLDKVVASETKPGCIIIDYFQNICDDMDSAGEGEYFVLKRVASMLDRYRKYVGCPIVVLVQLKAESDDKSDFKFRIEHCKEIYTKATCALEVKADRENKRTIFTVHKARFSEFLGRDISVGFEKGRYVKYTPEFKQKALLENERKKHSELTGLGNVFSKTELYEETDA